MTGSPQTFSDAVIQHRILVSRGSCDPELRQACSTSGLANLPFSRHARLPISHAPELVKPFVIFTGAMSHCVTLRRRLLELVRLRIAFHPNAAACMARLSQSALMTADGGVGLLRSKNQWRRPRSDAMRRRPPSIMLCRRWLRASHLAITDIRWRTFAVLLEKEIVELCM